MIELFDNWRIIPEEHCYSLAKYYGESKDEKGKLRKQQKIYGYYSSVDGALKALARELSRESLSSSVVGLPGAIQAIKESNERVEKYIESEIGKYEQQSKGEKS